MFLLIIPFSGHVPSIVPVRQVFLGSTVHGLSRTFKFVHVTLLRDAGITSSFPISPFCVLYYFYCYLLQVFSATKRFKTNLVPLEQYSYSGTVTVKQLHLKP